MYTIPQLKQLLKKSVKVKNQLERSYIACNSTVYTEQNEEELNDVKTFISYKIDLVNDIIFLISNFLKNKTTYSYEEFSSIIESYTRQFNSVCKDSRLKRLEQIYTRKINVQNTTL